MIDKPLTQYTVNELQTEWKRLDYIIYNEELDRFTMSEPERIKEIEKVLADKIPT